MTEIIAKILGVKPQDLIKEKTSITQRQELQTKIWRMDNDVRGSVDGWDFKHFVLGDTLTNPHVADKKPFDAIVSKPPYAIKWIGDDDPTLIHDDHLAPASVLAPKSKADFAFVIHALSYLSSKGRAANVCFPVIFYRGAAEQKIRKYLVENNFVDTIIAIAPNLFYGTSIAVTILVLSKHNTVTKTQFMDASGEDFFKKATNNNMLTNEHMEKVM